jgi:glycosyltransferase 2 family protein
MQKYLNRLIIGFGVAVVIYAVYLFGAELLTEDSAFQYFPQFPLMLLLPLALLQVAAFFFRWYEWHYYLGVIGVQSRLSIADSMILQVASFTMAVSPGKAGELLKSVVLKAKTGTDISASAPIVLAERVVDGIAVLLMMALAVLIGGESVQLQAWQRNAILLSAAVLFIGLIVVQLKTVVYFFLNLLPHIPLVRRSHGALVDFYESSRQIFHLRHVIPMIGVGVGVYGCSALTVFLILVGFGEDPTWTRLLQSIIIAGVSAAVGALSGSPNGAGVSEGSTQWILIATLGLSTGLALAIGLMHGFFNKWLRVFVGAIVGFIFRDRLFVPAFDSALAQAEADHHDALQPATAKGTPTLS